MNIAKPSKTQYGAVALSQEFEDLNHRCGYTS